MNTTLRSTLTYVAIFAFVFLPIWFLSLTYFGDHPRLVFRALGITGLGAIVSATLAGRVVAWQNHQSTKTLLDRISGDSFSNQKTEIVDNRADYLQKKMQKLTGESQRLITLLDSLGQAVIAMNNEEKVVLANQEATKRFSVTTTSGIHENLSKIEPNIHDVFWSGKGQTTEFTQKETDYSVTISPTFSEGETKKVVGVIILLHDVTKLRKLERIRQDFVANLSHELRTPISVIQSSAETLILPSMNLSEIAMDFAETIHRHSERMGQLIESLLRLSRIEAEAATLSQSSVDTLTLCNEVISNVEILAEERSILVESSFADFSIFGDREGFIAIFQNLLENAIKYSFEGGIVQFEAKRNLETNTAFFVISDSGIGIDEKHIGRIFERFYRVDEGRSRDVGGTGLGLAIVKHLVRAMGGSIHVESSAGDGSSFFVEFPIIENRD